jgi:hypothetical protein
MIESTLSKMKEESERLSAATIIRKKLLAALDELEEQCEDDVTLRVMASELAATIKRRLDELVVSDEKEKPA